MRKYALAAVPVIVVSILISLPLASGSRVAISYPPDTMELRVSVGVMKSVEIHLFNRGDEPLTAVLEPVGLENVDVYLPETVTIDSDSEKKVSIGISSYEKSSFSGKIHVKFETGSEPTGSGGAVVAGTSVPLEGIIVEAAPEENAPGFPIEALLAMLQGEEEELKLSLGTMMDGEFIPRGEGTYQRGESLIVGVRTPGQEPNVWIRGPEGDTSLSMSESEGIYYGTANLSEFGEGSYTVFAEAGDRKSSSIFSVAGGGGGLPWKWIAAFACFFVVVIWMARR